MERWRYFKEMKNKETILSLGILLLVVLIFASGGVLAQTESTPKSYVCAERTVSGAWCQNVQEDLADSNYQIAETSCESTSFCKLGTCVDSFEGLCQGNTPQRVCQENDGIWKQEKPEEILQCGLGCCYIGDGASFVTQTRCSALSAAYNVNPDFDKSIQSEATCISSAFPHERGACVIDNGFQRDCKLTTREECQGLDSSGDTNIEFNGGFLCSAESLGTVCGPSGGPKGDNVRTMLVEGKDQVYFTDSCGNQANVYDISKLKDQEYWTKIMKPEESCELKYDSNGNPTNSASCGNCDYFEGSIGKTYARNDLTTPVKPQYGNYVCADLTCDYEGEVFKHGESWCGTTASKESYKNNPGAESARLVCQFGEVTTESCSTGSPVGRNKVCVEGDELEDFSYAQCLPNRWHDCVAQDNKKDCINEDQRDCSWIEGVSILSEGGFIGVGGAPLVLDEDGKLVQKSKINEGDAKQAACESKVRKGEYRTLLSCLTNIKDNEIYAGAACVPKDPPGFDFWNGESQSDELCLAASRDCIVKFQKSLIGGWSCKENCECIEGEWKDQMNNMCLAIGDCGAVVNYEGKSGDNNLDDLYKVRKGVSEDES